jgi:hypothetical protein
MGLADPLVGLRILGFNVLLFTGLCNVFVGCPPPHLFQYLFYQKKKQSMETKTPLV